MKKEVKKNILITILFISLFILDRVTKLIFKNYSFRIINYTENPGLILGFLKNQTLLIITLTLILFLFLTIFYIKSSRKKRFFTLLILTGLFSNFIDRLLTGKIPDFIDFKFWPIFNLADSYVVIGVFSLIYLIISEKEGKNRV